jgi:hypothetical protein
VPCVRRVLLARKRRWRRPFARTFYSALFESENVGEAFQVARVEALQVLGERGDLTGYGAILYGDAGTKERRNMFTAA